MQARRATQRASPNEQVLLPHEALLLIAILWKSVTLHTRKKRKKEIFFVQRKFSFFTFLFFLSFFKKKEKMRNGGK
jgi:hypothetical protein